MSDWFRMFHNLRKIATPAHFERLGNIMLGRSTSIAIDIPKRYFARFPARPKQFVKKCDDCLKAR
jgi:hypothetical protein